MSWAFVHEYLTRMGGAERVLYEMSEEAPEAPVYSLLYDAHATGEYFPPHNVKESFFRNFPSIVRANPKMLSPLCPTAIESIDLSDYELVISSSNSFAKGIITKSDTTHVSYCHAPMLFAWEATHSYVQQQGKGALTKTGIGLILHYLRQWDQQASERVDYFIANSETTRQRIQKYYRREAPVIYPPVDVDRFTPRKGEGEYFLIASQLTPYKQIDLAIRVFNHLNIPLVILGDGPDRQRLEQMAASHISFQGFVSEEEKRQWYEDARGFIFPGSDDFGIAPVEAMAAGTPVLALRAGGATETIQEGVTGEFFDSPQEALLGDGVRRILEKEQTYDPAALHEHARQFNPQRFRSQFREYLQRLEEG